MGSALTLGALTLTGCGRSGSTSPGTSPGTGVASRAPLPAPVPPTPGLTTHGLRVVEVAHPDPRLTDVTLTTADLPTPFTVRVCTPTDYATSGRRYPVLWLLHGSSGDHTSWTQSGGVLETTRDREVIVVMPDGGVGGWYTDWVAPAHGPRRWETVHLDRLLPAIDDFLPTLPDRGARAIAGLSMGGFGALAYAGRHPDLFAAVASFSGPADIASVEASWLIANEAVSDGEVQGAIFGPGGMITAAMHQHNPVELLAGLGRAQRVALYCGTGAATATAPADQLEAWIHRTNVALAAKIARPDRTRPFVSYPGNHSWEFWARNLRTELPALLDSIAPSEVA